MPKMRIKNFADALLEQAPDFLFHLAPYLGKIKMIWLGKKFKTYRRILTSEIFVTLNEREK